MNFELKSLVNEPWVGSEEELSQEAIGYLALLDGPEYATPEYLNTHAGKKALGGYKNKILRSPRLARLAAINTLLQRTFYDLTKQKKPLESAGRWFHSSFDRYADPVRPMEIMREILDWAKSPYTLEEIALVLPLERQRQEAQWWPPESLHYPFASCVVQYYQVSNTVSDPQGSRPEENRDRSSLVGTQMKIDGLLRLSALQGMSALEAEQVATEIRQEASWYLYDIHVRSESHEGENAPVVEAYLVDSVFLVTYRTRQEWWLHHQEQLQHEAWQQKRKGGSRRAARSPALQ